MNRKGVTTVEQISHDGPFAFVWNYVTIVETALQNKSHG